MKIKLWSDLHLEFFRSSVNVERDGADVLVLAGDICVAREMPNFVPFFETCAKTFPDILYIAGNHEYYNGRWDSTYEIMREDLAHLPNIHICDGEAVNIQGKPFWAGTMWTDFNNGDHACLLDAKHGMNDYRCIMTKDGILSPWDTMNEHMAQRCGLDVWLNGINGHGGHSDPCVVVTHMAPSKQSIHPRYKDELSNGAYSSDLTQLMNPNVKLWLHGHTHDSFDYMEDGTRVVANPAGYPLGQNGERENSKFNPSLVLEV